MSSTRRRQQERDHQEESRGSVLLWLACKGAPVAVMYLMRGVLITPSRLPGHQTACGPV